MSVSSASSVSSVTRNELRGGQSPCKYQRENRGANKGVFAGCGFKVFRGFEGGRQEGRERRKEKGMNGKQVKEKEGERGKVRQVQCAKLSLLHVLSWWQLQ